MKTKKNKKAKNISKKCYNREKKHNIPLVDAHLHLRPFNISNADYIKRLK